MIVVAVLGGPEEVVEVVEILLGMLVVTVVLVVFCGGIKIADKATTAISIANTATTAADRLKPVALPKTFFLWRMEIDSSTVWNTQKESLLRS